MVGIAGISEMPGEPPPDAIRITPCGPEQLTGFVDTPPAAVAAAKLDYHDRIERDPSGLIVEPPLRILPGKGVCMSRHGFATVTLQQKTFRASPFKPSTPAPAIESDGDPMPEAEFLTVEEAAAYLRTTKVALYSQRHRGEKPGALGVRVGKRLLWNRADIIDWFNSRLEAESTYDNRGVAAL